MSPQRKRVYYITKVEVATSELIVPLILGRKTSGRIVTQITWPHKVFFIFPNHMSTKQAGLMLHK